MLTNHSINDPLTARVLLRSAPFRGLAFPSGSLRGAHEGRCSFRSSDRNNRVLPARPVWQAEDLVLMSRTSCAEGRIHQLHKRPTPRRRRGGRLCKGLVNGSASGEVTQVGQCLSGYGRTSCLTNRTAAVGAAMDAEQRL